MRTKRFDNENLLLQSLIGKSLEQAKELAVFNGFTIRVTREDNNNFPLTMDIRFDRIDVQIDNGLVTKCVTSVVRNVG
jgi:hypothetical protein